MSPSYFKQVRWHLLIHSLWIYDLYKVFNISVERLSSTPLLWTGSGKVQVLCLTLCFIPELRMMAEGRFASLPRSLHGHHTLGGGSTHPGVPSTSLGVPGSSSTCSTRRLQAPLASSVDLLGTRPGWVDVMTGLKSHGKEGTVGKWTAANSTIKIIFKELWKTSGSDWNNQLNKAFYCVLAFIFSSFPFFFLPWQAGDHKPIWFTKKKKKSPHQSKPYGLWGSNVLGHDTDHLLWVQCCLNNRFGTYQNVVRTKPVQTHKSSFKLKGKPLTFQNCQVVKKSQRWFMRHHTLRRHKRLNVFL